MIVRLAFTAIATLAIVACGSTTGRSTPASTHSPASPKPSGMSLTAPLNPEHGGTAKGTVMVTRESKAFSLRVHVIGLKPGSTHPSHIHDGACGSNGPVVFPLQNVVANASGDADVTTMIHHPYQVPAVPAHGWYVNVHQGPTMAGSGEVPILCAKLPPH